MHVIGDILYGVLFGALQGLTEFFPVSSSGHLVLLEKLTGQDPEGSVGLVIAVHGASLGAIFVAMWADIRRIVLSERRIILRLIVATVPVGVVGVFFKDSVEGLFENLPAVGVALIVTGLVLILVERWRTGTRTVSDVGVVRALLIGCAQAAAVMPGLSRSGSTIAAGLTAGLARDSAVRFSFLMSIPAIGGVCAYKVFDVIRNGADWDGGASWPLYAGAVVSSFAFSLLAMAGLLKLVRRHKLSWFALWVIPLGIAALIAYFV